MSFFKHGDSIHNDVPNEISAIPEKTTPVAADIFMIEDSEDSFNKKKIQFSNLHRGQAVYVQTLEPTDQEVNDIWIVI